ncbi:Multidrug resistance-associated protein 1 [Nymphon striatum]|nr:Multidrug resistance-associated protein 1 [Nymphon striatum]
MAVSTSRVKFEETLLKHKNDFLEILKNVHDVINNATSLDDAFFDKITPFGMNVLNLFASLLQLTNVNSRSELENIWKSHYHNESTREMIDEWLEAEDDWNNTLHDIDSKCLIQYTNEHQPDTPDVAVGSLMCDAELIEVKSGKTMTLKDHALSVQKCFRHQTLWFVANYLRTRGTLISLYEGDDIFQSGGDAVYDCKTKKVLHMYRGMDSSDRISVEALSIANVGLDVRKRPRVVALSPVRSGIRVRSDISCDISFTRARVFTSRPADLNLTWHTENPDFTDCFQNTALVWIPVAFLFIVTPYELWMQSVSRVSNIPWNSINILKLLFLSIQTALSVSMIVCNFISWEEGYLANTIAHFLLCLSYFYENNLLKFSVMLLTLRKRISNPETLLLYVVSCILARNSRNKVIFVATKLSDNELVETWKLAIDLATFPIIVFHVFLSCYPDHIPTSNKDKHLVKPNSTPEDSSSVLSQITFWWLNPLVIRGYKQPLVEEDQWSLAPRRRCVKLYNRFQHYWQAEISKRKSNYYLYIYDLVTFSKSWFNCGRSKFKPSIISALFFAFWPQLLAGFIMKLITTLLVFVSPLVLKLVSYEPVWRGVFYAIILFLSGEILSLFESQYLYLMHSVAAEFRSSLIAAIYKKALVISNNERKESTVGEIVNLMSVDTQHFLDLMPFLYVIWSAPLQIILAIYFLWRIIGPSALTGIAIMVFTIPLKGVIANITHKLQIREKMKVIISDILKDIFPVSFKNKIKLKASRGSLFWKKIFRSVASHSVGDTSIITNMALKDERTKMMNEILNGIRVLKLYAWEIPFIQQVLKVRSAELRELRKMAYMNASTLTASYHVPKNLIGEWCGLVNLSLILALARFFPTYLYICTVLDIKEKCPCLMISFSFLQVAIGSFATFIFSSEENILTPNIAFVSLSLFSIMRFPLAMLPQLFSFLIQDLFVNLNVSRYAYIYIIFIQKLFLSSATLTSRNLSNHFRIGVVLLTYPFFTDIFTHIAPKNFLLKKIRNYVVNHGKRVRTECDYSFFIYDSCLQTAVSVKRLNKFMRAEELDSNVIQHDSNEPDMIRISNASFTWGEARSEPVLKDISLKIKPNSLVAIVGRVGAGKSSLISAILGELHKTNGSVNVKGDVAYFPQTAWIRNASVKENIIMHKKRNEKKYQKIIYACGLKSDLQILPGGDNTEIGEKGINLSGGQKQRVSLARAVYSEADIVLLDDPLSAVDAHVGKHIFDNVIGPDGILNNTVSLVIMVTHGLSYLPQCDNVIVMEDGRISEAGSYNDLVSKNGAFAEFLIQYMNEIGENTEMSKEDVDKIILNEDNPEDAKRTFSLAESDLNKSLSQIERSTSTLSLNSQSSVETTSDKAKAGQLIDVEEVDTGDVNWSVYKAYAKTIGITLSLVFIFAWLLSQTSFAGSNIWLSEWSNDLPPMNGTINSQLRDLRLGVYAALGLSEAVNGFITRFYTCVYTIFMSTEIDSITALLCDKLIYVSISIISIFVVIGGMGFAYGTVKAGEILHENMLQNIMRSPMSFFDTTPMGRILNRFSKDINDIDVNILWMKSVDLFHKILKMLTIEVYNFLYFQRVYLASSRQLKRLESKTRSPIFIHFSESLTGASSIRAYKIDKELSAENDEKVDLNLECYLPSIQINRWLSLRVELLGNLIILFSALFAVLSKGTINAGAVGLSVSYAITVSAELNWLIRMSSELETNMVSVERILEYSDIEEEVRLILKDIARPSPNWPSSGKIEIKSYSTRYRKGLDLVLKNVSCEIEPLEKVFIGVCGRTGAGKSSLTLALFRIIESAGGKIIIDDIDISNLGLHDLRSKLTIIPQDPFLFSGTLKRNLDPFNNYSESDIWIALEHAHLKAFVGNLQKGLEFNVAEGGENLSVGQRQLICLARALLRKTRILILDEATAAVDLETDELIQETIRREFKDCTIITIAHRLNTIMDNSRVMVLDQGQIAEFDTPHNLLKIQDSIFYTMAKDAGLI